MKRFFSLLLAASFAVFGVCGASYAASAEKKDIADGEGVVTGEAEGNTFKWDIYGNLSLQGFYTSSSFAGDKFLLGTTRELTGVSRKDGFQYDLLNSSYVGINLSYGQFEAVIEIEPSLDALVNYLYGKYTFKNGGYLLVGQDVDIASYSFGQVSNAQNGLIDYGAINDVNRPMIKYGMHGLNIAVISPVSVTTLDNDYSYDFLRDYASDVNNEGEATYVPGADMQVFEYIPRVQISYDIESDVFNGSVFGAYAYYLLKTKCANENYKDYGLHSFHVGLGGQFDVTEEFFIQVVGYYGMNMMLSSALTNAQSPAIFLTGNDNKVNVENIQSVGGAIGFGYHIDKIFTPQIGAGFSSSFGGPVHRYDDAWGAYVNVIMQFNKWIALTPEIAFMDDLYDGNGNKQGNKIYAGAQIEVTF